MTVALPLSLSLVMDLLCKLDYVLLCFSIFFVIVVAVAGVAAVPHPLAAAVAIKMSAHASRNYSPQCAQWSLLNLSQLKCNSSSPFNYLHEFGLLIAHWRAASIGQTDRYGDIYYINTHTNRYIVAAVAVSVSAALVKVQWKPTKGTSIKGDGTQRLPTIGLHWVR